LNPIFPLAENRRRAGKFIAENNLLIDDDSKLPPSKLTV